MANNEKVVPQAESGLNKMKYEIANEQGVNLKKGYNGNISAKDAGKIGGNMVKRMIADAENQMKNK
jgi:Small, acid-soluble spore proteins, alpha/beta type.